MKALVFKRGKLFLNKNYPRPHPGQNEALIRISVAGICNTDLEIKNGYMGFQGIPGHEFVGRVEKCRDKALEGKRVVGEINIGCGRCRYCKNHLQGHCRNRTVLGILKKDGAFAEYITLPVSNLHVFPHSVSDYEAVFVEPLAAAFEITKQLSIKPYNTVCVLGDGKMGLLVAQVLSMTGCKLVSVGKHEEKLSILKRRGIKTKILRSVSEDRKFDVVIDCTGSVKGIEIASTIVKPRGTIVMKTTTSQERKIDMNYIVINEVTLVGSRCGPFLPAIRALSSRAVDVFPLVKKVYQLEEGIEAFRLAEQKGILKVLLQVT
jgi:threonine dehydrogenase-like Zn-dependent dehydrogenase